MNKGSVEDIYPLSPMQQGMLFHTLYDPQSGAYIEQMSCVWQGPLNVPAFERAWQRAVDRHGVLRTAFVWEGLDEPLQVVQQQVKLTLEYQDWRGLPPLNQQERLDTYLDQDRARGFELSQAPLMRLLLIRLAEDVHHFVWTHHHILLDGWSVALLFKEVFTFYEAFSQNQDIHLPHSRPYRDYIAWLQQQDMSGAEAFWRDILEGFAAPTPLAVDRSPGSLSGQGESYGEQQIRLSRATTAALKSLAHQHQLTLNTIVQAAWALLLSHYSGQKDVVFGVTVSGRPPAIAGVESVLGPFINTLPVRVQISSRTLLLALLKELQTQQMELSQYEYSPLVQVQGWSEAPRGLPLFESMLAFENYPKDAFLQTHLSSQRLDIRFIEQTNYPLTVIAVPGAALHVRLLYDQHRFDAAIISYMLEQFLTLLTGIAADPNQRIADLALLTDAEQRLLAAWNDTQADYLRDSCVYELFEIQVERTPDAIAVVFSTMEPGDDKNEHLTYRELNHQVNRLAHHLHKLSVGPEMFVGICLERSLETIVGFLGVLKAGGAYVPLDPAYPTERLAFMLQDAQATVLLTQRRLAARLPPHDGVQVVCLDTDVFHQERDDNPASGVMPNNLAYVIYTSGTTGKPKGIAMRHGHLLNLIAWQLQSWIPPSKARTLQFASLDFDISLQESFATWYSGGTLVLISERVRRDAVRLFHLLRDQAVERLFLPFVAFQQLAEVAAAWGGGPPTLREIVTAGEQLQITEQIAALFTPLQDCTLHNQYGPSECHVVTSFTLTGLPADWPTLPPIGRPLANTQIHLLDAHLLPVTIEIPGEVLIGGVSLARGYLNRPDLTADKFIPDPFSNEPGRRLYKTGDLARYLPDGNIEFLGRLDHQVKVRGFRIELGEVEAVLGQHPAVRQAVVMAQGDTGGNAAPPRRKSERLVAYVVPRQAPGPTVSELRRFLEEKLPDYMVPSVFVTLAALPLTPNAKIDRRALPLPDSQRPELEGDLVAPRTPVEELLAGIWAGVLGLERVGVHDNFFELGGHSLIATRLLSRLRHAFQVTLPLRCLFEAPTVAGLAGSIEAAMRVSQGLEIPAIERASHTGELPLSFAQQRLWILEQLNPNNAVYNIPVAMRLEGSLNATALEQSLDEIVRRHQVLRTTFAVVDGRPVQAIARLLTSKLPVVDLQALPQARQETEVKRLAAEEAQRPFDLAQGPLIRTQLLHLAATCPARPEPSPGKQDRSKEHVLLLTAHHTVFDGWSVGVFARELKAIYAAFAAGEPSPLAELPIQYADFALWQRQWLQGEALTTQLSYWQQQLGDHASALELPTDRPRPPVQTFRGDVQAFALPASLSESLEVMSRREGVTLFMTLLAAFQTLLYRYTGQDDVSVGTTIAGRNRIETEKLIGFFVNTLVLRADLAGDPTFRELLGRVRDVCLGAYACQDLPFDKVVEALRPERDTSRAPLFQVMFDLQNTTVSAFELRDLTVSFLKTEIKTAKFDLTLSVVETDQGLVGALEYNTDLFDAATIHRLAGHFQTLLHSIVANHEQRLSNLTLLTATEQWLLAGWNATTTDYPQDRCFPQLFEAQAARTPDAVAVAFEAELVTYRELNCRANQLAHHLQALGVGPEVLVGLCVERAVEMIVGLLGILKAGGAYVPLDPTYPQQRLAFMLQDARAPVLLTQQRLAERLLERGTTTVCLDSDWPVIARQSEKNPASSPTPDNLAYLIYTSGSTGKPKGTLIPHRGLSNYLHWCLHTYAVHEGQGAPVYSSVAFDLTVTSLFSPLLAGQTVTLLAQDADIEALGAILHSEKDFSLIKTTPIHLELLGHLLPAQGARGKARTLIVGGENLLAEHVAAWRNAASETALFNEYGPTETVVGSCVYQTPADEQKTGSIPIGRPVANTQIYLLGVHWRAAPVGVPGELCIGGVGLARGYLGQPQLSAEKFAPHPLSHEPGARLYRTGDMARYRPDGNIEFLGRSDHQVKVRGFRIELGEIEAVLAQHAAVRQAVVVVREDVAGDSASSLGGDKRLVAYVVPNRQAEPTTGDLRRFLEEKLPDYMLPAAFVTLAALPLTPNGKVDRRALPAPDGRRPELADAFVAPQSGLERAIAAVWREALGVAEIGVNDNFFDLGGHSLLMVQTHGKLQKVLGHDVSLIDLFKYPTVSSLAGHLSRERVELPSFQPSLDRARTFRASSRRQRQRRQRDRERE